jgi:hypothetical protein
LPTQEQIDRVLAPHQTIKERNLTPQMACLLHDTVWIRICYATDLQGTFEEILEAGLEWPEYAIVLDNKDLYGNYGEDWAKIFLRLPLLPNAVPYLGGDPEDDESPPSDEPFDDERFKSIYNASLQDRQVVYLIDEEAFKDKLVKLIFLDIHGRAVWHYTIALENTWYFQANYHKSGAFSRILETCYAGGD